jgi:hypothetical protein
MVPIKYKLLFDTVYIHYLLVDTAHVHTGSQKGLFRGEAAMNLLFARKGRLMTKDAQ